MHLTEREKGDVLVFLTGQEEIEDTCKRIREEIDRMGNEVGEAKVLPLYLSLPPNQQQRIFESAPPDRDRSLCQLFQFHESTGVAIRPETCVAIRTESCVL